MDPQEVLLGLQTIAGNIDVKDRKPETLEELQDTAYNLFNDFIPIVGKDYTLQVAGRDAKGNVKISAIAHTAVGKNFIEFVSEQLNLKENNK